MHFDGQYVHPNTFVPPVASIFNNDMSPLRPQVLAQGPVKTQIQDFRNGSAAKPSKGGDMPVLAYGACSLKGIKPYNEDRIIFHPKLQDR